MMEYVEACLIVPRTPNTGSKLTSDDYQGGLAKLEIFLTDCFGGFTVSTGRGAWVDAGRILTEDVDVYRIGFSVGNEDAAAAFDSLRKYVKLLLDQRTVYLSHQRIEDAPVQ